MFTRKFFPLTWLAITALIFSVAYFFSQILPDPAAGTAFYCFGMAGAFWFVLGGAVISSWKTE